MNKSRRQCGLCLQFSFQWRQRTKHKNLEVHLATPTCRQNACTSLLSKRFKINCYTHKNDQNFDVTHRGADKSFARPGRKQANVSLRMVWNSFGALPCRKINLTASRVSILLKSRAFLTCFQTCFLPGRAKDLSTLRYNKLN